MCGSICLQKAFVLLLLLTTVWTEVVVRIHNLHVKPSACNLVHLVHLGTPPLPLPSFMSTGVELTLGNGLTQPKTILSE